MVTGQRVLVVDGPTETEAVLRAVLEPRGLEVNRIRAHRSPAEAGPIKPSVVVLHEDGSGDIDPPAWGDVPRVIIGTAEFPESGDAAHYLQKPYHYGELIRAVEKILRQSVERGATKTRSASC